MDASKLELEIPLPPTSPGATSTIPPPMVNGTPLFPPSADAPIEQHLWYWQCVNYSVQTNIYALSQWRKWFEMCEQRQSDDIKDIPLPDKPISENTVSSSMSPSMTAAPPDHWQSPAYSPPSTPDNCVQGHTVSSSCVGEAAMPESPLSGTISCMGSPVVSSSPITTASSPFPEVFPLQKSFHWHVTSTVKKMLHSYMFETKIDYKAAARKLTHDFLDAYSEYDEDQDYEFTDEIRKWVENAVNDYIEEHGLEQRRSLVEARAGVEDDDKQIPDGIEEDD